MAYTMPWSFLVHSACFVLMQIAGINTCLIVKEKGTSRSIVVTLTELAVLAIWSVVLYSFTG